MVINNRLDLGSRADYAAQPPVGPWADYYTPEQRIGSFDNQNPWEACITLGTQWSWMPNDSIKSVQRSLNTLLLCAEGDGNLLYNLGPQPSGAFDQRYVDVLAGMGAWFAQMARVFTARVAALTSRAATPQALGRTTLSMCICCLHRELSLCPHCPWIFFPLRF